MKKFQIIFGTTLFISLVLSALFRLLGIEQYQVISGVPGLIILFLIFLGHFVTLDDDLAGGWSNPDASKKSCSTVSWGACIKICCVVIWPLASTKLI